MDLPKPTLSNSALLNRIKQYVWFHSIPLRPGIATYGVKSEQVLAEEEQAILGGLDLQGRTVLDVGAWNGYHSFAAKRRGAARVLATDEFAWTHPRYRGLETFELVRDEFGLDIESLVIDPTRITAAIGVFDVVLCLGVLHRLLDPIDVLQRLRTVTGQVLLIETRQERADRTEPGMVFHPGKPPENELPDCWGPNPALMRHLLGQLGFTRILYRHTPHPAGTPPSRGIYACLTPGADPAIAQGLAAQWRDLDAPGVLPTLAAEARG